MTLDSIFIVHSSGKVKRGWKIEFRIQETVGRKQMRIGECGMCKQNIGGRRQQVIGRRQ
jgi:hypothetical protein